MSEVLERFLRYVSIDTESEDGLDTVPSTAKQLDLAKLLKEELTAIGAQNVRMSDHGYVYAEIPATPGHENAPKLGFIAHMDTSPAVSDANVAARIVEHYDGSAIALDPAGRYVLDPAEYPSLLDNLGKDLIVTDGTTLLGADDKAGVAEIMTMAERLLEADAPAHGPVRIGFTPDEEVGRGVDFFEVENFDCDYAYTVDGGALGELEYENFNAENLKIEITGKSIHTGSAKGIMKNAILIANDFLNLLPAMENPACTEGYEGFYHVNNIAGDLEHIEMFMLLRDHDLGKLEEKMALVQGIVNLLNLKYGEGTIAIHPHVGYRNMKEMILPHMHLIENAKDVMREFGIEPVISPIRGGTDGARLSFMGLPCPNLCTGGYNFHGRFEYIPVQSLMAMADILVALAGKYA